jgi:acyl carrier protein
VIAALPAVDVEARIRRFFREQMSVEIPSADTDLFACGALDSLALVALLVVIEEELGRRVSLAEFELGDFQSISTMVRAFASDGPRP